MSSTKYESIWKILNENNFDVNEFEYADFICILCKKLLIDAKQAPCACKFCTKCIEEYLSNGNSICPGNTNECREESLHMRENISTDFVTNRKISKLKLKCPSNNCSYVDILMNMEQHLVLCGKPSVVCPYSQIGCSKVSSDRDEISNHLQLESYEHAHLMVEMIENLKNDIGFLTKENILLKEDSDSQEIRIEKLDEIISKIKEVNLTNESDLSECITEQTVNSYDDHYHQTNQSVVSNIDLDSTEYLVTEIANSDDDQHYQTNESEVSNNELELPPVYFDVDETSEISNSDQYKEFIWKIENFSWVRRTKRLIDSDGFYTHPNGYKMQLRVLPYIWQKSRKLGVKIYPNCVGGINDRVLQWPVKCEITIGIISERTDFFLMKNTQIIDYYTFDKSPVQPFVFFLNHGLCLENDCLVLKCVMKVIK